MSYIYRVEEGIPVLIADKGLQADWREEQESILGKPNSAYIRNKPQNIEMVTKEIVAIKDIFVSNDPNTFYYMGVV